MRRVVADRAAAMDAFARFFFGGLVASGAVATADDLPKKRRRVDCGASDDSSSASDTYGVSTERRLMGYRSIVVDPGVRKRIFSFCAVDIVRRAHLADFANIQPDGDPVTIEAAEDAMVLLLSAITLRVPALEKRCADAVGRKYTKLSADTRFSVLPARTLRMIFARRELEIAKIIRELKLQHIVTSCAQCRRRSRGY